MAAWAAAIFAVHPATVPSVAWIGGRPYLLAAALGATTLLGREFLPELDEGALCWLEKQPWPGNVRQLQNVIERAVIMSRSAELDEALLGLADEIDSILDAKEKDIMTV